ALPKDADELKWLGYSVGKWDGDTFVVDSTGFDERTWLDHFGNPRSDQMILQERYHRVDRDTLELTMTLTDPKVYTKPWVSEKKTFRLVQLVQLMSLRRSVVFRSRRNLGLSSPSIRMLRIVSIVFVSASIWSSLSLARF